MWPWYLMFLCICYTLRSCGHEIVIWEQRFIEMYFWTFSINRVICGHYGKLSEIPFNVPMSSKSREKILNSITMLCTQDLSVKHIYIIVASWKSRHVNTLSIPVYLIGRKCLKWENRKCLLISVCWLWNQSKVDE